METSEGAGIGSGTRLRSVEATAVAGVLYSVFTIAAIVALSKFPSLALSDEALTAWFDDTEHRPRSYWASTWRRCHRSRSCGSLPSSVFLFSTSTLILGTGALPKWASYLGYLLGTILFVFPLVYEPLGIALPVWVFIVSVAILVNRLQVSS